MGLISQLGRYAFRRYKTNGVPSSGIQQPDKVSDIPAVFDAIDAAVTALQQVGVSGFIVEDTKAALLTRTSGYPFHFGAIVTSDDDPDKRGTYQNQGNETTSNWVKIADDSVTTLDARMTKQETWTNREFRDRLAYYDEVELPKVVALGDSLTGANTYGFIDAGVAYVSNLSLGSLGWARRFDRRFNLDTWVNFGDPLARTLDGANLGLAGSGVVDLLSEWDGVGKATSRIARALKQGPKYLYLSFGTNDIRNYGRTAAQVIADLLRVCRIFTQRGIIVYLTDIRPWCLTGTYGLSAGSSFRPIRDTANTGIANIWDTEPLVFGINYSAQIADGSGYLPAGLTIDGLHLNTAGSIQAAFADRSTINTVLPRYDSRPDTYFNNIVAGFEMLNTGGTVGTGCTGTMPAGFSIARSTGTGTFVVARENDSRSQSFRTTTIEITPNAADSYCRVALTKNLNLLTANPSIAGIGTWVVPWFNIGVENNTNITTDFWRHIQGGIQDRSEDAIPSEGAATDSYGTLSNFSMILKGPPIQIVSADTSVNFKLDIGFKGTGYTSGVAKITVFEMGVQVLRSPPYDLRNLAAPTYS